MANFKYISENQANTLKMVLKRLPDNIKQKIENRLNQVSSKDTKIADEKITLTEAKLIELKSAIKNLTNDTLIENRVNSYRDLKSNRSKKRSFMRSFNSVKTRSDIINEFKEKNREKAEKIKENIKLKKSQLNTKLAEYSNQEFDRFLKDVEKYQEQTRKTQKRQDTLKRYENIKRKANKINEELNKSWGEPFSGNNFNIKHFDKGVITHELNLESENGTISSEGRKSMIDMNNNVEKEIKNINYFLRYTDSAKDRKTQKEKIKNLEEKLKKNEFQYHKETIYGKELYNSYYKISNKMKEINQKNPEVLKLNSFFRYFNGLDSYYDSDVDGRCDLLELKYNKSKKKLEYNIDVNFGMTKGYETIAQTKIDMNIRLLDPEMKKNIMKKFKVFSKSFEEKHKLKSKEQEVEALM